MKLYELLRVIAANNKEFKNVKLGYSDIDWYEIPCTAAAIVRFADAEVETMWYDNAEDGTTECTIVLRETPVKWNDINIIKHGHPLFE